MDFVIPSLGPRLGEDYPFDTTSLADSLRGMQTPTFREIRRGFYELGTFLLAVVSHYCFIGGGAIIGATLLIFPSLYQGVRVSGWGAAVFLVFVATFLAWRDQYQKAKARSGLIGRILNAACFD